MTLKSYGLVQFLAIKNRQLFEGKTFTESQESSFGADGPS
ncbi:hypothetical protein DR79_460 [Francisella tularensis]|nr:hypothetical protein DR79_460 [Francisella tularensis]